MNTSDRGEAVQEAFCTWTKLDLDPRHLTLSVTHKKKGENEPQDDDDVRRMENFNYA